jgi:D-alanyl-D-alanine carboxypeptidase
MRQTTRCGKGSPVYANGLWPSKALCALYVSPGQRLRRSAALAFNRMSRAYQQQTGSALCVNESYRSYDAQVAIKAALPGLAATPGRSNHGLGLALDLCGGVQEFGAPAHEWMKRNGPRFGWNHPAWAEPSGGLPEPWHWEFGG